MTSIFKLAAQSCGLTMGEATAFLNVREGTARAWWLGNRTCPESVVEELIDLRVQQDGAAQETLNELVQLFAKNKIPDEIEIGIASDDHEAQSIGWPCIGAHAAVIRLLMEKLPKEIAKKIKIVPRGTTSATAAASEAH
jgi:hypothetical protein